MSLSASQSLRWLAFRMRVLSIPMNLSPSQGLRWFAFRMSVLWIIHKHPIASVLTAIALLVLVAAIAVSLVRGPTAPCQLVIVHAQGRFPRWVFACGPH